VECYGEALNTTLVNFLLLNFLNVLIIMQKEKHLWQLLKKNMVMQKVGYIIKEEILIIGHIGFT
jgi:hypothetical protein